MTSNTDWTKRIRSEREARDWTQTKLAQVMEEIADEPLAKRSSLLRSIKGWEAGSHSPDLSHQRVLKAVFEAYPTADGSPPASDRELATIDFVTHLATQSGRPLGEVYQQVAARADELVLEPTAVRLERQHQRRTITCEDLTNEVLRYYDAADRCYTTSFAGTEVQLPILVEPKWSDMSADLNHRDSGVFVPGRVGAIGPVSEPMFNAAIERLAEAEATGKVLYDNAIYRLIEVEADKTHLRPKFGRTRFADFAIGCGLMEAELAASLIDGSPTPIRDELLPSTAAALDLDSYVCAGGPVALFAAARPASGSRPADYALLVQVRGSQVMDISGRLSTIPKGWHEPVSEIAAQADLRATLMRELEEELLGAQELELITEESRRAADPLHARARSVALEPFLSGADGFHVRATGFGLNLLSGTFEAPCLIAVDDESWWNEYGHMIGGNWESSDIEVYSSADGEGLARLARDPRWVFEGLFSLIEGLRVLAEVGDPDRVDLPAT